MKESLPDRLLDSLEFEPMLLVRPGAWVGHLPFAGWVVRELHPRVFVELGTHWGQSYFTFCQSVFEARLPTRCHAIDTWHGDPQAGEYGEEVYREVGRQNGKYGQFSQLHRSTFDEALPAFADGSVGLLHIDGLHTYEAVRHDFETWRPKLAPDALVLFHDTQARHADFGVWRFWEELTARYPAHLEFRHASGLGVLSLDAESPHQWLQPGSVQQERLIRFFEARGRQMEKLNEALGERAQLARRLESMKRSWSWRITAPLRWLRP